MRERETNLLPHTQIFFALAQNRTCALKNLLLLQIENNHFIRCLSE